ncbi:MAG TPA: hypothetical protein VGW33_07385 [Terriglobia bacterium]|nr:hypothetical protein [Terriglobia bacterium]
MQTFTTTFLVFLSAHLLTAFVLPTHRGRKPAKLTAHFGHGLAHYLTACALAGLVAVSWLASWPFQAAALGLTVTDLLILTVESRIERDGGLVSFVSSELLHLLAAGGAAWIIARPGTGTLAAGLETFRHDPNRPLALLVVYLAVVFGGGAVVRVASRSLLVSMHTAKPVEAELKNAGLYIGWLERFLILTALLLQSPSTAGLILTAKSVVRYPEMNKSLAFAEYFLIGTLLSISIAVAGGLILRSAW